MSRGGGLFGRYYFFTSAIVLVFIVLGLMTFRMIQQFSSPPVETRHSPFYAKLIDKMNSLDRVKALRAIQEASTGGSVTHFQVVDQNGVVIYPKGEKLPFDWAGVHKPTQPYQIAIVDAPEHELRELIRFSGEPAQYLYSDLGHVGPRRSSRIYLSTLITLALSALLGVAMSMSLLFRTLRQKARLADSVLAELQNGNLKARFPVTKLDEIGLAMSRFNRMADEIEALVERIQSVEKSRMSLLQELAHDLRTPVASLRSLLETLHGKGTTMPVNLREELFSLALSETDYFERLIEDLLVLAQVSLPRYHAGTELVLLNDLLSEEIEMTLAHGTIEVKKEIPSDPVYVRGDEHLLRRMIRNGLENALSFAKKEVAISLQREKTNEALILIQDDGPGFSEEALSSFGERRVSRFLGTRKGERLSVGLGSVILKTVAGVHGGFVSVANRNASEGVSGARLRIVLPVVGPQ